MLVLQIYLTYPSGVFSQSETIDRYHLISHPRSRGKEVNCILQFPTDLTHLIQVITSKKVRERFFVLRRGGVCAVTVITCVEKPYFAAQEDMLKFLFV